MLPNQSKGPLAGPLAAGFGAGHFGCGGLHGSNGSTTLPFLLLPQHFPIFSNLKTCGKIAGRKPPNKFGG
jgi:hypothetical protein